MPGINGPSSLVAIRNADDSLARLLDALRDRGLDATTDVILTSDHDFSTLSKESGTSHSATQTYKNVPEGQMPPGIVAIDLAHALGMTLFDPNAKNAPVAPGTLPLSSIGLEGAAVTPRPAIMMNFRSFSTGCADPTTCGVSVADTSLKQGQGMHGSFSRRRAS